MNENGSSKREAVKTVVRLAVGTLVEIFVGALTNNVVENVDGPKVAKIGAKAGGFLVGMMIGDQVGDYICGEIDDTMEEIDKVKKALDEEG